MSHADWRSIHAYTSRSFHRRCFPILYAGSPHSFHLSRTVRSGTARIAATSRDESMRFEPPRVPLGRFVACLVSSAAFARLRADARAGGETRRSPRRRSWRRLRGGARSPVPPAYLVCVALLCEFPKVPVKGCASHSGFPHKPPIPSPSSGAVQSTSHSFPSGVWGTRRFPLGIFWIIRRLVCGHRRAIREHRVSRDSVELASNLRVPC